ncbi:MAG TPA: NAD(P)-dependent oxidoreductase [Candidatus Saccharimonadales bacterium]|nr:NAD(P)-dependent oxidoreductase [Candidatus Saccharimonadales bacterium]
MKQNHPTTQYKKILVTGGTGTLGRYAPTIFGKEKVVLADKKTLDVTKKSIVEKVFKQISPDLVIHLAALTNVDICEKNKNLCNRINFLGTKNIVAVCKKYDVPLVFLSTASVFDGKKETGGYSENDVPKPVNAYAKAKHLAENFIQNTLENYIIVRAGWMIGGGKDEKKFISYIIDKIRNGEHVKVVSDKYGTISYAPNLLLFVKKLLDEKASGVYHFGSNGICSRFEMATYIKNMINKNTIVIPVSSKDFERDFPAPRPTHEVLTSSKFPFKNHWKKDLRDYIQKELIV